MSVPTLPGESAIDPDSMQDVIIKTVHYLAELQATLRRKRAVNVRLALVEKIENSLIVIEAATRQLRAQAERMRRTSMPREVTAILREANSPTLLN